MGQQQLLLLVLGIVIVGLAVVVGIQAFGENQKKANADALVNDAVRIASDAQAWKLKPAAFGGGASGDDADNNNFTSLDGATGFQQLGYELSDGTDGCTADTEYGNLNGCFSLAGSDGTLTITGKNTQSENQVVVTVVGTSPENISTVISSISGS